MLWFAMNPNCPELIRAQILASQDDQARRWLGLIDGWSRTGATWGVLMGVGAGLEGWAGDFV